jgi:F-box interacting protein
MALIFCRSFAHRHFTTQSPTSRILFFVDQPQQWEKYLYSAEIKNGGTLGPAIRLPPIPVESFSRDSFQFCNGLFCVPRCDNQVPIFSPDTGEVSTLPDNPGQYGRWGCFDRFFGFDPSSNKHKVLLVHAQLWLFWIFTLGSGSWRQIHAVPPEQVFYVPFRSKEVVYANGAIHWIFLGSESVDESSDGLFYRGGSCLHEKCILAFDMVEEQFRKIPFPDDLSFPAYLAEFGGRLALMEEFVLWKRKSLGYDVVEYDKLQCWVLEDCKNPTWIKETVHLPFGWMRHNKVLAFNNNTGEMLLTSANMRWGESNVKCLLYYNTKTGIFRRPQVTGKITEFFEIPKKGHARAGRDKHYDLFVIDATFDEKKDLN